MLSARKNQPSSDLRRHSADIDRYRLVEAVDDLPLLKLAGAHREERRRVTGEVSYSQRQEEIAVIVAL